MCVLVYVIFEDTNLYNDVYYIGITQWWTKYTDQVLE